MGKRKSRVKRSDGLIVPGLDHARVDAGERRTIELERRPVKVREIIVDGLRRDRHRYVDDLWVLPDLGIGHVGI